MSRELCLSSLVVPLSILRLRPHCYARVIGVISEFKKHKSLNILDIRRVADAHEPFYHLVHAATVTISVEHDRNVSASFLDDDLIL